MNRFILSAALALTVVAVQPAHAADTHEKFDRAAFIAAQNAGKPILVEVNAWWCPVCASQSRTIKAERAKPEHRNLVVFRINYDQQKAEWKSFGARKQATLIAFKGKNEVGRLEYVTDKDAIRGLLARTGS